VGLGETNRVGGFLSFLTLGFGRLSFSSSFASLVFLARRGRFCFLFHGQNGGVFCFSASSSSGSSLFCFVERTCGRIYVARILAFTSLIFPSNHNLYHGLREGKMDGLVELVEHLGGFLSPFTASLLRFYGKLGLAWAKEVLLA